MDHVHGAYPISRGARYVPAQLSRRYRVPAHADLVAILEALHDVLVQLSQNAIDARYVDFAEMANRLGECMDQVREP